MAEWRIINPETAERIEEILRQSRAHTKACAQMGGTGKHCTCGAWQAYQEFQKAPRVSPKNGTDIDYITPPPSNNVREAVEVLRVRIGELVSLVTDADTRDGAEFKWNQIMSDLNALAALSSEVGK